MLSNNSGGWWVPKDVWHNMILPWVTKRPLQFSLHFSERGEGMVSPDCLSFLLRKTDIFSGVSHSLLFRSLCLEKCHLAKPARKASWERGLLSQCGCCARHLHRLNVSTLLGRKKGERILGKLWCHWREFYPETKNQITRHCSHQTAIWGFRKKERFESNLIHFHSADRNTGVLGVHFQNPVIYLRLGVRFPGFHA